MFMDFVTKEGTTYYLKAQTGNVALIGLKMYKRHSAFPTFCSQQDIVQEPTEAFSVT